MKRALPRYVSEFIDRHGKPRLRYRRKGQAGYYFQAKRDTPAFWKEYAACLDGTAAPEIEAGQGRSKPGSIDDLFDRYYRSPKWLGIPKESSRRTFRRMLERWREGKGDRPVAALKAEHIDRMLGKMSATPHMANNLRKRLKMLFAYAVKIGMRPDNPVTNSDAFRAPSAGFHTWTEQEIEQFEAHHPPGSKARLAMALMLWTGQRRSDIVTMGRQHITKDGKIRVRQVKTGWLGFIHISRELAEILDLVPADQMTFLITSFGRPYTANGFGNWFRVQCNEAGLPHCSAHGLRKAMSRRLAESGATHSQAKAITGHLTDQEFTRYAAQADQPHLASAAMSNLEAKLAISSAKSLKRG